MINFVVYILLRTLNRIEIYIMYTHYYSRIFLMFKRRYRPIRITYNCNSMEDLFIRSFILRNYFPRTSGIQTAINETLK